VAQPKILLFDIENSPILLWAWGIHDDPSHSMKFVKEDWYVMCWAAKWLGEDDVVSLALTDFRYNHHKPCDKKVLKGLWSLLDEADIVVAHNGKNFDCRKSNARFMKHGIKPPSPYRVVDTLTEARKHFMFTSNRLGDLGEYLGVGSKMDTGGFELWKECMEGNKKSWKKMVDYCKQDVVLLEKIYLKLQPYMSSHPNVGVILNRAVCPVCGSDKIQYRGYAYTNVNKYRQFVCKSCGAWRRDKKKVKEDDE